MDPKSFSVDDKSSLAEWLRGGRFGIHVKRILFQNVWSAERVSLANLRGHCRTVEEIVAHFGDFFPLLTEPTDPLTLINSTVASVELLHNNGVYGLDFRPSRVYSTPVGVVLSKRVDTEINGLMGKHDSTGAARFLLYCAPEVIQGVDADDQVALKLSDIWSFGCLCLYILSQKDPQYYVANVEGKRCLLNKHKNPVTAITVMVGNGDLYPEYLECCESDPMLEWFFTDCFKLNPKQRTSIDFLHRLVNESQVLRRTRSFCCSVMTDPQMEAEKLPGSPKSPVRTWTMMIHNHSVVMNQVRQLSLPFRASVFLVKGNYHKSAKEPNILYYVLKEITIEKNADKKMLPGRTDASFELFQARWKRLLVLQNFIHENVVRYYHFEMFYRSPDAVVVVLMEWCQMGNLAQLFKDTTPDLCALHKLTKDIVAGVAYIHGRGIFHGDINPDKVLVGLDSNNDLQAKIGDLDDSVPVGTFAYLSPERRRDVSDRFPESRFDVNESKGQAGVRGKADIWSMGCTFVYLAAHRTLSFVKPNGDIFEIMKNRISKHNESQHDEEIENDAVRLETFIKTGGKPQVPSSLTQSLKEFIGRCLIDDPLQRLTAKDLLVDPWMLCDPEVRYVDGMCQRPLIINLRSNNLLPRHTDSETEDSKISWSNNASCGIRLLAHFQAPKFNIADAGALIHKCPKALEPGKPLQRKYCDLLRELMPELRIRDEFVLQMAYSMLSNEQMLAAFTKGLQPVGAAFPELVDWMNTFEDDYEYVVKEDAAWSDIQAELEAQRPVLVMTQSGRYKIEPSAKQALQAEGIPDYVPALHVTIVHGFIGSTNESRVLFCTSGNGILYEWSYSDFIQSWDWKLNDWRMDKVFEGAQVRRRSMVYRCEKYCRRTAELQTTLPNTVLDMTLD